MLLIEFMKVHTCMWDMKLLDYRNAQMKNQKWEELAKEMGGGVTPGHLKAAFKNLRNWNTKLDKEADKSGSAPRVLTGRDMQVQQRMQFMKNSVTHRPAPMVSAKAGGPSSSQSRELIQSVDDQALEQPEQPSSKKRRPSSASTTTSAADAEALEGLQSVMSRNTDTLRQMLKGDDAPVDLDDPLSAKRAIHKSFCQYVTSCVMTYEDAEFDQFQTTFTLLNERFKAERREAHHRATTTTTSADAHYRYSQPTISSQTTAPVAFNLYGDSQHTYQQDPSTWLPNPPHASLYGSQTSDYNLRYLQEQQRQSRGLPVREPPLPNIIRRPTSTPKRAAKPSIVSITTTGTAESEPGPSQLALNFSDFTVVESEEGVEGDSQDHVLTQLE